MSRLMGLDYGTKRVGVALSDETHMLAHPHAVLPAEPFAQLVASLKALIQEKQVVKIVVGVPRNMDGTEGDSAKNAREFIARLKETLAVPIATVDERMTTLQASRQLQEAGKNTKKQKGTIDAAAAAVLLQTHLDGLTFNL
jgi:putative Holliday junction resolvase